MMPIMKQIKAAGKNPQIKPPPRMDGNEISTVEPMAASSNMKTPTAVLIINESL